MRRMVVQVGTLTLGVRLVTDGRASNFFFQEEMGFFTAFYRLGNYSFTEIL